jgi:two-component system cell cycle sensor histidine kinase/response regulator CckA
MNGHAIGHVAGRVLIVDDEPHNRELLRIMLAAEGVEVQTASSGQEALARLAREPAQLVLLDIMMPEMDGYQVLARIKGDPATTSIPVIMVTALDDQNSKMLALKAGAEDFLTKPVDRVELYVRVRNLLRLKAYGDYHRQHSQLLKGEVDSGTAALADSEHLYRSTFEAAPVGIVHVALDGRWLRVNERFCEFLDYARAELQDTDLRNLIQAEEAPGEREVFERMATGTMQRHVVDEKPYRRRDGSVVWARVNMSLHRDSAGRGERIISVVEDITERRRLEAEVRESVGRMRASEQRYRMLLEGANDAIAVLTPEGVVREMNQRWVDLAGRPREELLGSHVRDLAPRGSEDSNVELYRQAITTRTGQTTSLAIVNAKGENVFVEYTSNTIEVAGEPLVMTIARDVTQRRELEEQLLQAQKLEVIGQLAGGVAHDFNNLLTAILGFSELVMADLRPGSAMAADVLEIKQAAQRAAGLTQQLLAFGRKQILQPRILDINTIVSGMEPMLRRLIAEHVSVVVSLEGKLGSVRIDPTQFEQIVVNLAVNAADAMPQGGRLTIETANITLEESHRQPHLPIVPGDYVMLSVSDTGVGMDEATSRHMFEPFFTTKEVGRGTGLGLATVHGIVKQSGGDIRVHSEPGHGSTFQIYLPEVTGAAVLTVQSPAAPVDPGCGSETVLLVEDDGAVRRLARVVLERAGYRVMEAENPKVAFRLAKEAGERIDLLLSDLIMPESDGPPLFLQLVALRPALRVLYMSGYADEAIVRHGVIVEGTPFLQKPFTPPSLTRMVREVLDGPPTTGRLPSSPAAS